MYACSLKEQNLQNECVCVRERERDYRMDTHTQRERERERGLLEWLTDYGSASPTMNNGFLPTGSPQKSSSCSVYEAECLSWSLVYSGILKKQALILVTECTCTVRASRQRVKPPFFLVLYVIVFQQKEWLRLKVDFPTSKGLY